MNQLGDEPGLEGGVMGHRPATFATVRRRHSRRLALAALTMGVALAPAPSIPGAPPVARAAECAGDECEAPPPAPEDPTPGTAVVEGPSNPPVRFPTRHVKKHSTKKHRHKRPRARG
jgi:hypothetical protein